MRLIGLKCFVLWSCHGQILEEYRLYADTSKTRKLFTLASEQFFVLYCIFFFYPIILGTTLLVCVRMGVSKSVVSVSVDSEHVMWAAWCWQEPLLGVTTDRAALATVISQTRAAITWRQELSTQSKKLQSLCCVLSLSIISPLSSKNHFTAAGPVAHPPTKPSVGQ